MQKSVAFLHTKRKQPESTVLREDANYHIREYQGPCGKTLWSYNICKTSIEKSIKLC